MPDAEGLGQPGAGDPEERIRRAVEEAIRRLGAGDERAVLTNNRVRLVSVQRPPGRPLQVRVARRLLTLGPSLAPVIAGFALGDKAAAAALRRAIAALPPVASRARRRVLLRPVGDHHDLVPIAVREAARMGLLEAPPVTWGNRPRRRRRRQRTMRLGSYIAAVPYVRLHRALDHPAVPAWYLGFVIFHELLHHQLGRRSGDGTSAEAERPGAPAGRWHHKGFLHAERQHPRYEDARRWERVNVPRLLAGLPPVAWEE